MPDVLRVRLAPARAKALAQPRLPAPGSAAAPDRRGDPDAGWTGCPKSGGHGVPTRGQPIDDAQHIAFASRFGTLERTRLGAQGQGSELSILTNIGPDGAVVEPSHRQWINTLANQLWHSDSSFKPIPALHTFTNKFFLDKFIDKFVYPFSIPRAILNLFFPFFLFQCNCFRFFNDARHLA